MTGEMNTSSGRLLAERLRRLREAKNLSQRQIQERTGLLSCYTSRVENGYTVPSLATLTKYANALEVPLHHLFHDNDKPVEKPTFLTNEDGIPLYGTSRADRRELRLFIRALSRMSERERDLLLAMAFKMARRNRVG